jgi:hypothetical protein
MKKIKLLSVTLSLGLAVLVSSCSNQMYSYRQKVNVDHSVAQTKKAEPIKEIEAKAPKSMVLPVQPAPATQLATAPVVTPEMKPMLEDIKQVVPQNSSKASTSLAKQGVKSVKGQMKSLKKEIKAATEFSVDGKKWMIVGIIVWAIGVLISFILSGTLGWAVAGIGSVIFLVGLIFFLIDYLK